MQLTPTFANVLLEKIVKEKKTASGILLLKDEDASNFKATVVSIGPDVDANQFKIGDIFLINSYVRRAEYGIEERKLIVADQKELQIKYQE